MEYDDLIYETVFREPNYKEIFFDKFLERCFKRNDLFLFQFNINEIRDKLIAKFGDSDLCFENYGELSIMELSKLNYYQSGVGIDGPKHSLMKDPVFVINYKGRKILFNGYHRTLQLMLNNVHVIQAYELEIA